MAHNKAKDTVGSSDDRADQDIEDIIMTVEERFLLEALQGFVLPHIGASVDAKNKEEMMQRISGLQAKKFIAAVRGFISSIVSSAKIEVVTTINVALDEMSEEKSSGEDVDDGNMEGSSVSPKSPAQRNLSLSEIENPEREHMVSIQGIYPSTPHICVGSVATFHDKVLLGLRAYVFNKMPIRLMKFVKKDSLLEVSLIERERIYEHLVPLLQARMGDNDYRPMIRMPHLWETEPQLETEDDATLRILEKCAGYAILSHTWLRRLPELTYGSWKAGKIDLQDPGYLKLVNFCKVAYEIHGFTLGWMDTVCINKDSSSELDESIRSMYKWYERSKVCIVYLSETDQLTEMHRDSWFTRGWTLQELLAPNVLKFYNKRWERLVNSYNDKTEKSITIQITRATSITTQELMDISSQTRPVPISRRMQLAAQRKTTREEDTAYSLMGLFDVSFTTAYGEGTKRAFRRLLQEILNSNSVGVLDLFNWAGEGDELSHWDMLPPSPEHYIRRSLSAPTNMVPIEPLTLTHIGLRIPALLMPGMKLPEPRRQRTLCYTSWRL